MSDEIKSFNLNRPEATAKDEYLYLWQTYEINLAHLICTSDAKFDARIPRMVRFMISLIAHDNIRYTAEEKFDAAIQYANSRNDLSLDERNEMIMRICSTMCGSLTSYVDQFKGLAHQLKVGELVNMSKKYYLDSTKPADIEDDDVYDDEGTLISFSKKHINFTHTPLLPPLNVTAEEEEGYTVEYEDACEVDSGDADVT